MKKFFAVSLSVLLCILNTSCFGFWGVAQEDWMVLNIVNNSSHTIAWWAQGEIRGGSFQAQRIGEITVEAHGGQFSDSMAPRRISAMGFGTSFYEDNWNEPPFELRFTPPISFGRRSILTITFDTEGIISWTKDFF